MSRLLIDLHQGLDRLGPGDRASTLRALSLCGGLPDRPDVLDVGCGAGAQTLDLAGVLDGTFLATDLFDAFLATARARFAAADLSDRITTLQADMADLPFDAASFDLIWSEGAVYLMGFDAALSAWRPLLRPGGYLVVSEACWFRPDPPPELARFWADGYPAMRSAQANFAAVGRLGYTPRSWFPLPDAAWSEGYYGPLAERFPDFLSRHDHSPEAQTVVASMRREIELFERYSAWYGYGVFVLRASD